MKRKEFLTAIIPMALILSPTFLSGNKKFPIKDIFDWEYLGSERFNSDDMEKHLLEIYNLKPSEYKIDFSSGKIVDCELGDYQISRNWNYAVFCVQYDIYLANIKAFEKLNTY